MLIWDIYNSSSTNIPDHLTSIFRYILNFYAIQILLKTNENLRLTSKETGEILL